MNRREFSGVLAAVAGAALLSPLRGRTAPQTPPVSAHARALYRRALVLDCNSAPPLPDTLPVPQADLDLVRGSGISALKWSLGGINSDFAATVAHRACGVSATSPHRVCNLTLAICVTIVALSCELGDANRKACRVNR